MGHVRLGRLPKTLRWREVIELLDASPRDTAGIAAAVVVAAESRLRELRDDPSLSYSFWLLTRIALASRGEAFTTDLAQLGVPVNPNESVLTFISRLTDEARRHLAPETASGHFTELASLALRRSLTDTVGQEGASLFGSTIEDLQAAFRSHSSRQQFGALSRRFFGDFLARTLRSFIDRELPVRLGSSERLATISDSEDFSRALDAYARQSASILEDFASGWYSKQNWESKGDISLEDAQAFVAVGIRKLRMELKLGTST